MQKDLDNYHRNQTGKNAEQIKKEKEEINELLFKQYMLVVGGIDKVLKK